MQKQAYCWSLSYALARALRTKVIQQAFIPLQTGVTAPHASAKRLSALQQLKYLEAGFEAEACLLGLLTLVSAGLDCGLGLAGGESFFRVLAPCSNICLCVYQLHMHRWQVRGTRSERLHHLGWESGPLRYPGPQLL